MKVISAQGLPLRRDLGRVTAIEFDPQLCRPRNSILSTTSQGRLTVLQLTRDRYINQEPTQPYGDRTVEVTRTLPFPFSQSFPMRKPQHGKEIWTFLVFLLVSSLQNITYEILSKEP